MRSVAAFPAIVHRARDQAQILLRDCPLRWRHTIGVARRADELTCTLDRDADGEILVAAAWLHDIGYASPATVTGFHPLDGAEYLRRQHWPPRIVALVAHHSGAQFVARVRGLTDALSAFPWEQSALSDALTYADQTTGPSGERMTVDQRMADMLRRHGPDSPNALAHRHRAPYLRAVTSRVNARLLARSDTVGAQ